MPPSSVKISHLRRDRDCGDQAIHCASGPGTRWNSLGHLAGFRPVFGLDQTLVKNLEDIQECFGEGHLETIAHTTHEFQVDWSQDGVGLIDPYQLFGPRFRIGSTLFDQGTLTRLLPLFDELVGVEDLPSHGRESSISLVQGRF